MFLLVIMNWKMRIRYSSYCEFSFFLSCTALMAHIMDEIDHESLALRIFLALSIWIGQAMTRRFKILVCIEQT